VTLARRGTVALALIGALVVVGTPRASARLPDRGILVVLVPHVSFEQLMSDPSIAALGASGGAGLIPASDAPRSTLRDAFPSAQIHPLPASSVHARLLVVEQGLGPSAAPLRDLGAEVQRQVQEFPVRSLMVMVVGESHSPSMLRSKDDLFPVVLSSGPPQGLFGATGPPRSLTSDSTGRNGVVTADDLVSTILEFSGEPVEGSARSHASGSVIRFVEGSAPFELHERYLAMRRMSVPIQTAAGLYATVAGLLVIALLALRRRVSPRLARAGAWLAMSVPGLAVGLLAAGHLPTLSYATVVPFVIGVGVVGTVVFAPLARRDAFLPPAAIGSAVLAYFVIEAAFGWTAALTPFLGDSELGGGRFYGLPNVFIGLLVGASLYVASRLPVVWGFVLIAAVALFAGLPFAGSNLGGAVTLFVAAGLWLPIRRRGRLDWRGVGVATGVVIAGTALVLIWHRFLTSVPTHVTRFEETSGRSLAGVWRTFTDRLAVGWRLIVRNPLALVPVFGVPAALYAVVRPPASVRSSLVANPAWRDAMLVTLLAGLAAYVANDSGPAALGLAFGLGLGGLLYGSLIEADRSTADMGSA
jgi:hypothetical protein